MGIAMAGERRLLAEDEFDPVASSHYPALEGLSRDSLVDLARWLRARRARARDIIRDRRRVRRGKIEPRSAADAIASERGLSAKKQVFARALKRVNARLDHLDAEARRARALAGLHAALARKRAARVHHPTSGATAHGGMRPNERAKSRTVLDPSEIGRVSQSVRAAQARADARGA